MSFSLGRMLFISLIGASTFYVATPPACAEKLPDRPINIKPLPVAQDNDVKLDYPIVYVRSPRWVDDRGKQRAARWAEFAHIFNVNPGSDLMLLNPDGSEEVLVEAGPGAVQDPYVSFDGQSVYYTLFHEAGQGPNRAGADIYRVHVPTRTIERLTGQVFNAPQPDTEQRYGVYNMHPCPLPGGRVAYVSSRNGYLPPPKSYPAIALQLHTMDAPPLPPLGKGQVSAPLPPLGKGQASATLPPLGKRDASAKVPPLGKGQASTTVPTLGKGDASATLPLGKGDASATLPPLGKGGARGGSNIETIGHLNLAGALHPVILKDGRIIFSSLENMGLRNYILWGIWSIHPDGTNWGPFVSALHGHSSPSSWHFQTQLSDGTVVVELYYNQNQKGFGSLFTLPPKPSPGKSAFGPGNVQDDRNPGWDFLGYNGKSFRTPFTPQGMQAITPWIRTNDFPAWPSVAGDEKSPRIGKVTHPCRAPDNHLLVAWTLGPIGGSAGATRDYMVPQPIDSGIYLVKGGKLTKEPGQMLLLKNDPKYNEQWPRPLVSYRRIYGVDEPQQLSHKNDGSRYDELPEGTPYGLVGTSSFYKRESAPMGTIEEGSVTATFPKDYRGRSWDRNDSEISGTIWNWRGQGADAGRYGNEAIHAVRIVAFEPNTYTRAKNSRYGYPPFENHAMERLRILGEVPLRKFVAQASPLVDEASEDAHATKQPLDPDGNPDTSFLAKIPADVAFTFQTIDTEGRTLNMAQTWHQVRPGEARYDCGGCHAHSQQPTLFEDTLAAQPDYKVFDLTETTPLVTSKQLDQSNKQWDAEDTSGLRYVEGPYDVEYFRDVQPILARSCVACHSKSLNKPAAGLVLDDDDRVEGHLPGTYFRLAADERAKYSPRLLEPRGKGDEMTYVVRALSNKDCASHYIWKFQSRRSLLAWKLYGRRLDGWHNDDIPSETVAAGDPRRQKLHNPYGSEVTDQMRLYLGDVDNGGSIMPPPAAVKAGKVQPLSDEDRRTLVRWIDLGCPIDLDPEYDPKAAQPVSIGYLADDHRPTLTMTHPQRGSNAALTRILLGMHDYESGLNLDSLSVTANFDLDGTPAGENLASRFVQLPGNRWQRMLAEPLQPLSRGVLTVSVQDAAGNITTIERTFSVGKD